ncbi:hypothetical protein Tco_1122962 [Tanacetum coccineum]|uniref:Uncharacterized protein n=1 Tax=Tanacetum coccineum TaxID=301880 RepID=A0ABQ5J1Z9_9ASTR
MGVHPTHRLTQSNITIDDVQRTNYSLPPEETSYSLPPEETGYSLPPEGIGYSLPPEGTGYSLPPEGASYSLPPEETLLLRILGVNSDCLPQSTGGDHTSSCLPSLLQDTSIVKAKLSSRGSTSVASMYQTLSYLSKLSSRGSARQYTNSDGDNVAACLLKGLATLYLLGRLATPYLLRRLATPCLLKGLATPCLLRGLATPCLLRGLATPCLLGGLATPYLLRRHYSLVIASGPEVAFVTPAISVNRSNMKCLRPRLPDPNFRMINLSAGDTAIGIYSRIFDSSGVRIPFSSFLQAVLKYFKVHISHLAPLDKVPTSFNQNHVDQLKAHILKLRDIPEEVLVRSGLSRVWRNPMCDPVLRRSDNTVISIYDFFCMPSLDNVTVREEPHGLDTSILGKVVDSTTSLAPAGTTIPRASLEEIVVTRPDRKVVTKADHTTKRKASTRPEMSTNVAKKTRSNKKGSGAGSSGQAAGDEVKQTDDGTLDDDDQRDGLKFAMEGIDSLNDVSQGEHINVILLRTFDLSIGLDVIYPLILFPNKEVEAHAELYGAVRRATRASFCASHDVSEDASPHA